MTVIGVSTLPAKGGNDYGRRLLKGQSIMVITLIVRPKYYKEVRSM